MVEGLDDGLATRAEVAAADGIERIAFDFFNGGDALANFFALLLDDALSTHDADDGAASGGAFGADAGVPAFFADGDVVLGDQERDERIAVGAAAAGGCSGGCAGGEDFEEVSPFHIRRLPASQIGSVPGEPLCYLRGSEARLLRLHDGRSVAGLVVACNMDNRNPAGHLSAGGK